MLQRAQDTAAALGPRLRDLMDRPGAGELRAEIIAGLSRRFAARTMKFILGPQASANSP